MGKNGPTENDDRRCARIFSYHDNLLYVYRETPALERDEVVCGLAENAELIFTLPLTASQIALAEECTNFTEPMLGEILGGWLTTKIAWEVKTEAAYQAGDFVAWGARTQERIRLEENYWTIYDSLDRILQRRAYFVAVRRQKCGVILTDGDLYALTTALDLGVSYESLDLVCTSILLNRTNSADVVRRFVGRVEWLFEQGGVIGDWKRLQTAMILRPLRRYEPDPKTGEESEPRKRERPGLSAWRPKPYGNQTVSAAGDQTQASFLEDIPASFL